MMGNEANQSARQNERLELMMAQEPLLYSGILRLDTDGCGSKHNDPKWDPHTWWQPGGKDLNSDTDSYIVAPPWVVRQGVRAGDSAEALLLVGINSQWYEHTISSHVGDTTLVESLPVGEMSIKAARDLSCGILETNNGPIPTLNGSTRDISVKIKFYPSRS